MRDDEDAPIARVYFSIASWKRPALKATFPASFSFAACLIGSTSEVDAGGGCSGSVVSMGPAGSCLRESVSLNQSLLVMHSYSWLALPFSVPLAVAAAAALACVFFFCCDFFLFAMADGLLEVV